MAFIGRFNGHIRAISPIVSFAILGSINDDQKTKYGRIMTGCSAFDKTEKSVNGSVGHGVRTGKETSIPQKSGISDELPAGSVEKQFYGIFPERQLWKSRMPHPALWDSNWDGLKPDHNCDQRRIRREGITRHIILIRHGQYDETHREDEKRILTPLGREQAERTGKRLAEIVKGIEGDDRFGPCNVKVIRVSNLSRAKETADIIAKHLPGIQRGDPDPLLNEGRPCHNIPCGKVSNSTIEKVDENHPRIEEAFQKYFYRAAYQNVPVDDGERVNSATELDKEKHNENQGHPKHEFEIIVCHANLIRYFFCRALQLPPEAWLRLCTFNCSLTYFTVRPTGTVSCRMLGDIGHLGYDNSTFSMHHGFNW